jgi:phage tail-like protein
MGTGDRKDPFQGYRFRLQIEGIQRAGFRECTGLDSTQDPVEYREGNEKEPTVRKLAGLVKYSNVVLKWGVTDEKELWEWRQEIMKGNYATKRKSVTITLMDDVGNDKAEWRVTNAWPSKWTGPSFNATSNDVAIQTLELAHEGVERTK